MLKKTKLGYEIRATINSNGTVTIPPAIRELVGKNLGDEIAIIIPESQEA